MRLLHRPMAEGEFWKLIEVMGGQADDDAVARLTESLVTRRRKDVLAFQERLARVLYDLDREVLALQPVRFTDDPPDSEPIPLSDDVFLYLRAGIVARGYAAYQAVLAEPSLLASGEWDECEALLYVADEVLGEEIDTKVSYETGSNDQHWTAWSEPLREAWDQDVRLVYVDCRDLSDPIDSERIYPDGRTEPMRDYMPPRYISHDLIEELTVTFAKLIAINGGLPAHLRAEQVQVIIDFGDVWQLEPEVGEPVKDPEFDIEQRPVRVSAADIRAWDTETKRLGLLALAASCVLAVLPNDHAARDEIQRIHDRGAPHLPR